MDAKRFYLMLSLIRCGETHWEAEGRMHGATDLPLSDGGRDTVLADSKLMPEGAFSTIYHPPDEAASETAKILARVARAKTKAVETLADPDLGLLEGMLKSDFAERQPKRYKQWEEDPMALTPPEGEPIVEARQRILDATVKLLRRTRAEKIAVVAHPVALGLLRCRLAERPVYDLWRMVKDHRRRERYAVATALIERLREEAGMEIARS